MSAEKNLPPLPEIDAEDRQWLSDNPNTSDIVAYIQKYATDYALAAIAGQVRPAEQCGIAGMLKTTCPYCEQGFTFDCPTCSGHGLVGGHIPDGSGHGEPCPDCNAPQVPAPVGERELWLPIESAPKDGRRIFATGPNFGDPELGWHQCSAKWFNGAWMESSDWSAASELQYLTHYIPTPPDPQPAPQTKGQP